MLVREEGDKTMIPKKIHYCWFGGKPFPEKAQKCISSWKKYCPDYEIIEWNESNFDIHINPYVEMCYNMKQYAFLTDYLRLVVLEKYGGIYMDTDVEVVKPLDPLLDNKAYFGFENDEYVNTGEGCGAEAHNPIIIAMIKEYEFLLDGNHGTIGCPILNTEALKKFDLVLNGKYQDLGECSVYPSDFFNPYDDPTGRLCKTNNTYSIHWYAKSWMSRKSVIRSCLTKPLHRIFGTNLRKRK